MNKKLLDKHIELVEAVNNALLVGADYSKATERLEGFRLALDIMGINQLMACDRYYLDKGVDRPMCCGVFL